MESFPHQRRISVCQRFPFLSRTRRNPGVV